MLNALLAINMDVLLKSVEILWKGLLAMVIVIGIIIIATYLVQNLVERATLAKKVCEKEKALKEQQKEDK